MPARTAPRRAARASGDGRPIRCSRRRRLLLAAALCVALLLCRARVTALADECDTLAGRITELADENAQPHDRVREHVLAYGDRVLCPERSGHGAPRLGLRLGRQGRGHVHTFSEFSRAPCSMIVLRRGVRQAAKTAAAVNSGWEVGVWPYPQRGGRATARRTE